MQTAKENNEGSKMANLENKSAEQLKKIVIRKTRSIERGNEKIEHLRALPVSQVGDDRIARELELIKIDEQELAAANAELSARGSQIDNS